MFKQLFELFVEVLLQKRQALQTLMQLLQQLLEGSWLEKLPKIANW